MTITSQDILKQSYELLEQGKYNRQVQVLKSVIADMIDSVAERTTLSDEVLEALKDSYAGLSSLIWEIDEAEHIEIDIHGESFKIEHYQGNGRRSRYVCSYKGRDYEIGKSEKRVLVKIIQHHPESFIMREDGNSSGIYGIIKSMTNSGFGDIWTQKNGKIRFLKPGEIPETTKYTPNKKRVKNNFGQGLCTQREDIDMSFETISCTIDENQCSIYRLHGNNMMQLLLKIHGKAEDIIFSASRDVIENIKNISQGISGVNNKNQQRDLSKAGIKIVRKNGKLCFTAITGSQLANILGGE